MNNFRRPQVILLIVAVVLLAATFARPMMELPQDTYRFIFVFDISQSMNVADVPNTEGSISRLTYAKQATIESLTTLPCGTEIGLALFTGHRAFLLITPVEICANYRELSNMVGNIDWRMTWEARSEIAKGLYKSIALLKQLADDTRLVFITDGHEAPPINPELPPQFPGAKDEVAGLIIGVGGDEPVPIPKFGPSGEPVGYWQADEVAHVDAYSNQRNAREGTQTSVIGTEHLSSLRESYLQGLADKTGLVYRRLGDLKGFSEDLTRKRFSIPKTEATDMRWLLGLTAAAALLATMLAFPLRKLRGA